MAEHQFSSPIVSLQLLLIAAWGAYTQQTEADRNMGRNSPHKKENGAHT